MGWSPNLDLETLRPGERKRGVGLLKRLLKEKLVRKGSARRADRRLVALLNPRSNHFNRRTRTAVMVFQKRSGLPVTGIVDRKTWLALGVKGRDLMPGTLRGIPYPPEGGVRPLDGNWVALPIWNILAAARKAGKWSGFVNSGWRPDWYQKVLWDKAVERYGSTTAAAKWVAPPGTSKHRYKDERGAVDVEHPEPLLKRGLYRPMPWEPWHLQIKLMSALRRLGRLHPELADEAPASAIDAEPDTTLPEGVDIDIVLAFVDNDLEEIDQSQKGRES